MSRAGCQPWSALHARTAVKGHGPPRAHTGALKSPASAARTRAAAAAHAVAALQAGAPGRAEGRPGSPALPTHLAGGLPRLGGAGRRRAVLLVLRAGRGVQGAEIGRAHVLTPVT